MAAAAGDESDFLDSIALAEERFHGEGYQEGYSEGNHVGITEGKRYGFICGTKMGLEMAGYYGFAFTWKYILQNTPDTKSSKRMKTLDSLLRMIKNFPYEDPLYDKLHEDLDAVRAKFKQISSLLNVVPDLKIRAEKSELLF
ncbi:protein LTO1 homolog [Protopterus annectens]|uniref:protein LTO1 homolog n=1 Tax=Protopterus annectens TaxID=7888 RepID=UPI001CFA74A3|nr:protein LTO1 homolog [Protopterus annectens]